MLELHRNVFYNIITSGKRWVKTIHAYARTHVRAHTHTPMQTQVIQRSLISYKEDFFFSSLCRHLYASCACPQSECRLGRSSLEETEAATLLARWGRRQTSTRGRPPRRGPHQLYPPSRELFRFCCGRCHREQWEGAAREKRVRQAQAPAAFACRKGCTPGLMPLVVD